VSTPFVVLSPVWSFLHALEMTIAPIVATMDASFNALIEPL
jgi:hypothetical protein